MCGRFTITHPNEALVALFGAAMGNDLPPSPRFNICPTQAVAVVTSDTGQRRLRAMRWGFVPSWYKAPNDGPLIINARSETIATKPAFREAVRTRRCLVPASGFYEWQTGEDGAKLPWYFTRTDGQPMALAGVWQRWGDLDTCAIVSTEAGPGMAGLHHREALMLEPADWPLWLGEAGHGAAVLMQPSEAGRLVCHRVDRAVNSNRAEGPGLIAPIAA
ncbi:MAG: SOS response-associated peptidase [Rhodobacteraceae bacterium]|nr:SOS response-associated peptidase [Paracoccaceae bacterium]